MNWYKIAQEVKEHDLDCPECGSKLKLHKWNDRFYYRCQNYPDCKVTHGAFKDGKPQGVPGDLETIALRKAAHNKIKEMIENESNPKEAQQKYYNWLARKLNVPRNLCHMALFDKETLRRVIGMCNYLIEQKKKRKEEIKYQPELNLSHSCNWHKISQQEKLMILVRCPPGGGKSTLAKQLAGNTGIVLESDEFFMQQDKYVFDKEKQIEAHNWNQERCLEAMENGITPIIIANTNTQAIEAEPYVRMAIGHGYKIRIEEPHWHKDLKDSTGKWNFDFLKGRNVHGVPEDVLKTMIDRYENKEDFVRNLKQKIIGK
jgi:ssDNA-binding Zn-finger/Zn-ribbon topoisomerase 1